MKRLFLPVAFAAALLVAGCSQNRANPRNANGENQSTAGQDVGGKSDASPNALNADDKGFARLASAGNQAEVTLASLALQKAASPKVKQFAQRMVDDHGQAQQQLQQVAGKKDLDLPSMIPTEAKEEYDKLAQLSAAEFDQEYVRFAVADHQKDVQEFKKARNEIADPDLKQFVSQTLPIVERHLKMAQQLEGKEK